MPDISITEGDIELVDHTALTTGIAGEALTSVGLLVYSDSADNGEWKMANAGTDAESRATAYTLTIAADGERVGLMLLEEGKKFKPGGTVVPGQSYGVSANDGAIAPESDWTTDDYMTGIGLGVSTTEILVSVNPSGAQHP